MIIQHKITGRMENVTSEQWNTIKEMGFASNWSVIDSSDKPIPSPSKDIPVKILEFSNKRHPGKAMEELKEEAYNQESPLPSMDMTPPPGVEKKKKKRTPNT